MHPICRHHNTHPRRTRVSIPMLSPFGGFFILCNICEDSRQDPTPGQNGDHTTMLFSIFKVNTWTHITPLTPHKLHADRTAVQEQGSQIRQAWVSVPAPATTVCVSLGKLSNITHVSWSVKQPQSRLPLRAAGRDKLYNGCLELGTEPAAKQTNKQKTLNK